MKNSYDVIVIGGGAAGLLCGGFAAKRGLNVLILEKNERLAHKLRITGKGRCNITNNCDDNDFIKAVKTNGRFLYSAIAAFSTKDTMDFFEGLGVPLKTERGNRVFPVSDQAIDVVNALIGFAKKQGAIIRQTGCKEILWQDDKITGVLDAEGNHYDTRSVVLATGGMSYPLTGSTGDGYKMAKKLGHTITEIKPSLIPIVTKESWCAEVMGLSLKNVTFKVTDTTKKNKVVYEELGEMLFTHFGVSGPLVLSASSHMSGDPGKYGLAIDLKPGLTYKQLDARLLRDFEENLNKDFVNSLGALLPRKLIPIMVKLSGIPEDSKINQITKEQRTAFGELVKGLPLTPKAFRPIEEAIITSGGVAVKEISPQTMESKLVQGLFFAGELIDVDAYTGGYNLQIAFSTAYLAAQSLCKNTNGEGEMEC